MHMYLYVYVQMHLNKLECRVKVEPIHYLNK